MERLKGEIRTKLKKDSLKNNVIYALIMLVLFSLVYYFTR
jgi:hypothetical protein